MPGQPLDLPLQGFYLLMQGFYLLMQGFYLRAVLLLFRLELRGQRPQCL